MEALPEAFGNLTKINHPGSPKAQHDKTLELTNLFDFPTKQKRPQGREGAGKGMDKEEEFIQLLEMQSPQQMRFEARNISPIKPEPDFANRTPVSSRVSGKSDRKSQGKSKSPFQDQGYKSPACSTSGKKSRRSSAKRPLKYPARQREVLREKTSSVVNRADAGRAKWRARFRNLKKAFNEEGSGEKRSGGESSGKRSSGKAPQRGQQGLLQSLHNGTELDFSLTVLEDQILPFESSANNLRPTLATPLKAKKACASPETGKTQSHRKGGVSSGGKAGAEEGKTSRLRSLQTRKEELLKQVDLLTYEI